MEEFGKECVGKITSSVAKGVYDAIVHGKKTGYIKITKGENEKIHCEVIN